MTASIVSTLAGADALTYIVCFAPLALIYLLAAIELSGGFRRVATEAPHEFPTTDQEVPYKDQVAALKRQVHHMLRSGLDVERAALIIHELEQRKCFREHGRLSKECHRRINKEFREMTNNHTTSRLAAEPPNLVSTASTTDTKPPENATLDTNDSELFRVTLIDTNDSNSLRSNSITSDNGTSAMQKDDHDYDDSRKLKGFLDLPLEIRNAIYQLVSTPLADTQPCLREKSGYDIQVGATTKFFISSLAQTCRLIREEYMLFLFAKHEVTFSSLGFARKWQVNIDNKFTSLVKRFTIDSRLLIAKDLTWRLGDYRKYGPAPPRYLTVDLHAELWTCAGTTHLKYIFFCSEEFKLCAQSMYMVQRVLTAAPFSSDYFTFNNFLVMTDMISNLKLHGHQDRASDNKGMVKLLFHPSFAVNDQGLRHGKETKLEIGEDHFYFPMKD